MCVRKISRVYIIYLLQCIYHIYTYIDCCSRYYFDHFVSAPSTKIIWFLCILFLRSFEIAECDVAVDCINRFFLPLCIVLLATWHVLYHGILYMSFLNNNNNNKIIICNCSRTL